MIFPLDNRHFITELKNLYTSEEWIKERDSIIKQINSDWLLCDIYAHENLHKQLLDLNTHKPQVNEN